MLLHYRTFISKAANSRIDCLVVPGFVLQVGTNSRKSQIRGESKSMILGPFFQLKFLEGICSLLPRSFKWAAPACELVTAAYVIANEVLITLPDQTPGGPAGFRPGLSL